jgi:hypothetical protein
VGGPNDGAVPVASFTVPGADLTDRNNLPTMEIPMDLPAGDYQVLGFLDANANADTTNPNPDHTDPVTLPIGAYTLHCARQPAVVEFAIRL